MYTLRRRPRTLVVVLYVLSLVLAVTGTPASAATLDATSSAPPVAVIGPAAVAQQQIIQAADGVAQDRFGEVVAISGDLVAVSALDAMAGGVATGAVYLYQRDAQSPSGWAQIRKLYPGPPYERELFGAALALHGDTLVVGASFDPRDGGFWQGAVYVYERNQGGPGAWGVVTQLADETAANQRLFGGAVDMDGDLVAVGVRGADGSRGKVYLYSRSAGWARVKTLTDPGGQAGDEFGTAVALEGDTLVVGARYADAGTADRDTGAAFVFQRDQGGAGQWGQVTKLVAGTLGFESFFGETLTLEGDTLVVAAPNQDRYAGGQLAARDVGAAFVYGRDQGGANAWGLVTTLQPPDGLTLDFFGSGLALAGNELWIGAPNSNKGGFDTQGIVYHYSRNEGGANAWGALPVMEGDNGSLRDKFGSSLAVDGDTLVAGAPGRSNLRGAAYVVTGMASPSPAPAALFLPLVRHGWLPPTGTLTDGGSLAEPGGAIVGAVPGTLTGPVDATITPIQAPSTPLPSGFVARGDHYYLGAGSLIIAPADKPLLVGLPVPDNADTAKLAVAAFVPDGYTTESEDPETPASSWTTVPGGYDAANDLFVITLRTLLPEGMTLVLFEHPENVPLPGPATTASAQPAAAVEYRVECDLTRLTTSCTPANRLLLAAELQAAHSTFVDTYGFRPPALRHAVGAFTGPAKEPKLIEIYYGAQIGPANCTGRTGEHIDGQYSYLTLQLLVCMPEPATADDIRLIVRHELFHAIQASYPNVAQDRIGTGAAATAWLIEGTAAAAERSGFLMLRSPDFSLRPATEPLTSTVRVYEYDAQDFWVYTGLVGNQPLSYVQAIFDKGATLEHANEALPLADAYWSWAKNQVIEHHETMVDAFEKGPCQLELAAIKPAKINVLTYPSQYFVEGPLLPLTSALVQINVTVDRASLPVFGDNNADRNDLRYKVYGEDEAGCRVVPDGMRTLLSVAAGTKLYVLVANVGLSEAFTYAVEVD